MLKIAIKYGNNINEKPRIYWPMWNEIVVNFVKITELSIAKSIIVTFMSKKLKIVQTKDVLCLQL